MWILLAVVCSLCLGMAFSLIRNQTELRSFCRQVDEISEGSQMELTANCRQWQLLALCRKLNHILRGKDRNHLQYEKAETLLKQNITSLAHDIRTPLTSVIGYLSLLEEAPDMPTEQKAKYVHITLEKANRLEQLINEFFEITKYNIQEIVLEKEEIDLYYMLLQMLEEFYPLLEEKGNRAVLHSDENVSICGDPAKLARVFNNILKNAVAYSDRNTQIDIFVEEVKTPQQEKMIITFRNQGKTIPKEKLESIFDKFYRLDADRNSHTGGAGLGLAIAKEIVTRHGGRILAESGNGQVTFRVELPAK